MKHISIHSAILLHFHIFIELRLGLKNVNGLYKDIAKSRKLS